jgi:hypothetical protein
MSNRDKILVILAFLTGIGGLVHTLLYSDIVEALNARRPPDDQIPFGIFSWDDFKKTHIQGWFYWKALTEFHREFPRSKLYRWSIVSLAWMFVLFLISIGVLFSLK